MQYVEWWLRPASTALGWWHEEWPPAFLALAGIIDLAWLGLLDYTPAKLI